MTVAWSSRRWSSPTHPDGQAVELLAPATDGEALSAALRRSRLDETSFLIFRVEGLELAAIAEAVETVFGVVTTTRLCLTGNRATLDSLPGAVIDDDRVGLMLDDVDAHTPLADVVWDRIEAIRFGPDFVARAGRNMRLGFVLESMLGLARELGLCTLGANPVPGGARVAGRFEFDYLPAAVARDASAAFGGHALTTGR